VRTCDAPACAQENATSDAGYTVRSDATDVIRWCLGPGSGDKSQLTLVLNRPYAMVATLDRGLTLGETTGGTLSVGLAQAATETLGGKGEVTLSPGGTTTVVVDLPEGGSTRLHAEFDGFAQALVSLQLAAELIAEFATLMRFKGARRVPRAYSPRSTRLSAFPSSRTSRSIPRTAIGWAPCWAPACVPSTSSSRRPRW